MYYLSISNGDFNTRADDVDDILNEAEFELGVGSGWVLITDKPITGEIENKLQELLK